jgi:hypothetical protein
VYWGREVIIFVLQPLVELTAQEGSINTLSRDDYVHLTDYFNDNSNTTLTTVFRELSRDDFRRVRLAGNSTSLWVISPPAREQLVKQLRNLITNPNANALLEFDWSISRYR